MASLSDRDIEAIAQHIAGSLKQKPGGSTAAPSSPVAPAGGSVTTSSAMLGAHATVDEAIQAAEKAQPQFAALSMEKRAEIIADIRRVMIEEAASLARDAHTETRLGRFDDKILKNILAAQRTPGTEDLVPIAMSGDRGLTLEEPAPFGVIGAITPTTNPTSTIICNTIGMIAAGNAVVFNAHPRAKNVSARNVSMINEIIVRHGGPGTLVNCIAQPTIESAQQLMTHKGVRLLVVTGGPGVVEAAMKSGKRAICAGPGNPPVVVDETADLAQAGRDIVLGASTDNNIICVCEKQTIVVEKVADDLIRSMQRNNAFLIDKKLLSKLEQTIFTKMAGPRGHATLNRDLVGQNASVILGAMGISVPDTVRLGIIEVEEDHPLVWTEQMMPIMPIVRVPNADYAISLGISTEQGNQHSAHMHSRNVDNMTRMARGVKTSIFVKNGRSQAGLGLTGEGYTSFTIATPTGEGLTRPRDFARWRRCTLVDAFRIV
jgi:acyl-CoA reductase-like NAD-dependent aldehyde dehydrogenase